MTWTVWRKTARVAGRYFKGLLGLLCLGYFTSVAAQSLLLASTTSTEQSGLFAYLLPIFSKTSGIAVKVVALGTGQALDLARRGDADLLLVHDQAAEEKFVAEGHGLKRHAVMYNDFVLIGPLSDPAAARGSDIAGAMQRIARGSHAFVSRGDKSGTHAAELRFWSLAVASAPGAKGGSGYRECGCGMGPALNMASASGAYTLADRGTWLSFRNRGDLALLVEGDQRLFNAYSAIVVNPARHPHVKRAEAQAFVDWITSVDGQRAIAGYRIGGEQLFFPNASR